MKWLEKILGARAEPASAHPAWPGDAAALSPQPDAGARRAIARWDDAIADILARWDRLLQESVRASEPLIGAAQLDLVPLTRAWSWVEHRMHEHTEEISRTWDAICDELAEHPDTEPVDVWREARKRDLAQLEIEIRYTRALRSSMARAAEAMRRLALEADVRGLLCRQCGAPLEKAPALARSSNVGCAYCNAVNTVEPGKALRAFAASGARCLAEHEALAAWEAMVRAGSEIRSYRDRRDVPMPALAGFESSARAYWTTRFEVEALLVPEERQYVAVRLERAMKDVERTLREHWQWRQRPSG